VLEVEHHQRQPHQQGQAADGAEAKQQGRHC
jgi:hypothetical protein